MAIMKILKSLCSCLRFRDFDQGSVAIGNRSKNLSSYEKIEQGFFIEDLMIEILSRLPIDSINDFKFVSKQWLKICLQPSFGYSHFEKSARSTSGVFIQGNFGFKSGGKSVDTEHLDYISLSNEGTRASVTTALDFLPEKVVVLASGNGVILCRNIFDVEGSCFRNPQEVRLYVCNPFIKEWTTLKPRGRYKNCCCYGFSYSVSVSRADFQVVIVEPPRELGKDPYQFTIYSSKTGIWKISSERCHLSDRLLLPHSYVADGVYYWLTNEHTILAFDLEHERSQVIKVPGQKMVDTEGLGVCLGVSEGRLHHVSFNMVNLTVWALEYENLSPKWVLKHFKPTLAMNHPVIAALVNIRVLPSFLNESCWSNLQVTPNCLMQPLSLRDDLLYLKISRNSTISSYNIKTGEIEEICSMSALNASACYSPTVLPYAKSLLHVNDGD